MATFRNISGDARSIAYGLPRQIEVQPTAVFNVSDEFAGAYETQTTIWQRVPSANAVVRTPIAVDTADEEEN